MFRLDQLKSKNNIKRYTLKQLVNDILTCICLLKMFLSLRYMDSFEQDTKLCIEMEYCDGGSLAQFLTNQARRLEEKEILIIFHQICAAIRYMHEHQILHRWE